MKNYEIWVEGYQATGNSSLAQKLGEAEGNTFKEACVTYFKTASEPQYFDSGDMTYWGCKLYSGGI